MNGDRRIEEGVYIIGGPDITSPDDAAVFIVDCGDELIMIDSGAGRSFEKLVQNIEGLFLDPYRISTLVLTHCHIDHIGSAPFFRDRFGSALVCHEFDAGAIESGDPVATAATWYDSEFPPTPLDRKLTGDGGILQFGDEEICWIHTPGHTPGSVSLYIDREGKRILFGQDIHGPFLPSFKSDIEEWKRSMAKLLDLDADILCEGHFGIYRSKKSVKSYIKGYLRTYSS
ncbi:MAG: MBL fold metallo-hydrolase [Thermodesulfobacteriota bacterium]|nr:MBL fold metallo-hydrolase [Thermodesulfobacteriota bacterium]